MFGTFENSEAILRLFLIFLALSLAAVLIALVPGSRWGDLSSRRQSGEALTEEERRRMKRARLHFVLLSSISLLFALLAFYALQSH